MHMRWISSLAIALIVACQPGDSDGESEDAPTISDSAGVTIVDNSAIDLASIPRWTVDTLPSLTIGVTAGDSAYEFGNIDGVRQLPNGMLVVLSGAGEAAFEFRFYDSTGKHIATHGRRGQGPGEYQWVNYFGSAGGDTLVAVDFSNKRLNWLSASSGYLRSVRLDDNPFKKLLGDDASGMVETMVPFGDSVYAVKAFRRAAAGASPSQRAESFHIVNLATNMALELMRWESPPARTVELSFGPTLLRPPGAGRPVHVVDRGRRRICALITNATRMSCIDHAGKRTSIRWRDEVVPFTAEDRQADEATVRRNMESARGTPGDAEKLIAARELPERHLPVTAFHLDTEGNFWILEPARDAGGRRSSRFRIIAPDGRMIAFADSFPARNVGLLNRLHIGEHAVFRVIENPDGAPAVALFRIRKPDQGARSARVGSTPGGM
jgi:hypothetical protein